MVKIRVVRVYAELISVISKAHKVYRGASQSELRRRWANSPRRHHESQVNKPKITLLDKYERAEHNYQIGTWLLGQLLLLPEHAGVIFAQEHNEYRFG